MRTETPQTETFKKQMYEYTTEDNFKFQFEVIKMDKKVTILIQPEMVIRTITKAELEKATKI